MGNDDESDKETHMLMKVVTTPRARVSGIVGCALLIVVGIGCQGSVNVAAPPTGETILFSTDIQPIFNANCTTCHRTGGQADMAGILLKLVADESFDLLVDQPSSQRSDLTLVLPGDADGSLLFLKVSSNSPPVGATMPLVGARLSSTDLGLIRDWINQGALDN